MKTNSNLLKPCHWHKWRNCALLMAFIWVISLLHVSHFLATLRLWDVHLLSAPSPKLKKQNLQTHKLPCIHLSSFQRPALSFAPWVMDHKVSFLDIEIFYGSSLISQQLVSLNTNVNTKEHCLTSVCTMGGWLPCQNQGVHFCGVKLKLRFQSQWEGQSEEWTSSFQALVGLLIFWNIVAHNIFLGNTVLNRFSF